MADKINHTSTVPIIMASIIFCIPSVILYFMDLYLPLLIYSCVMTYLMITGITNIKYRDEIVTTRKKKNKNKPN